VRSRFESSRVPDTWDDDGAEDIEARAASTGTSAKQLAHILFKRKWLVLGVLAVSLAAGQVARLLTWPAYLASSQILVNPGREHVADFSLQTGGALPPWVRFDETQEIERTVELLTGRSLAERVVRTLGAEVLYPRPAEASWPVPGWLRDEASDPAERDEGAIGRFMRDVSADGSVRSAIVTVAFKHGDPEVAARAVNLLAELYVERYLGVRQDPKANAFFEEQFKNLKQKLRESEGRLLAFKQRHGINSSVSEEQALLREMQTGLRQQLNETRSKQAELQSQDAELQRQMAEHGSLYGNLQAERLRNGAEGKALRAREAALTAKVAELQARLDGLERMRDEYSLLEKQVKADEDSYKLYLTKFEELRITGAMDKERIVSVRVIEPAHVPAAPVKSKLDLLPLLSLPFGLFAGVALALLVQFARRTLDTAADVENALALPVLASIPHAHQGRAGGLDG
jgi:uncharacterized protein involved in exopolysaccharide biosynthesis